MLSKNNGAFYSKNPSYLKAKNLAFLICHKDYLEKLALELKGK